MAARFSFLRSLLGSIKNTLLFNFHSGDAISFDWRQAEVADGAQCSPHIRKGAPLRARMGIITRKASVVRFSQWPPMNRGCDM